MYRTSAALVAAIAALAVGSAPALAAGDPDVTITTPPWSVLAPVALPAEGTATASAGVSRVEVTFCGNGSIDAYGGWSCGTGVGGLSVIRKVTATLSCDAAHRSCTWAADPPANPDRYLVFAKAYDAAGATATDGPVYVVAV